MIAPPLALLSESRLMSESQLTKARSYASAVAAIHPSSTFIQRAEPRKLRPKPNPHLDCAVVDRQRAEVQGTAPGVGRKAAVAL